jgi:hypothetical protein
MKTCACKRAAAEAAGWTAPGLALALLAPKCPMCVAGYVAAFTGLGIGLPVAAGLKTALIVLSVVALAAMALWNVRRARRWFIRRRQAVPVYRSIAPLNLDPTQVCPP